MPVLKSEKFVGIETFYSNLEGIGGKLKTKPEDFIVTEISNYPKKDDKGIFTIADVTSINWENNLLIRQLSKALKISRNRINFAGTKDKRAKTKQIMSFYKISIDDLKNIKLKDVKINNFYNSNKAVKIGNLIGNSFLIKIRDIEEKNIIDKIEKYYDFFQKEKGFPNFFGIQRFGITRPNTHIIGKNIVKGDFKKAALSYIGKPSEYEDKYTYQIRKKFDETKDFKWALQNYPKNLNYELSILNKLAINPKNYIQALKELPKNLLTMFIYGYQSYLFNKIISDRIKNNIPINKAILGDIILPVKNDKINDEYIFVNKDNINKVNNQISKQKAYVSGLLIGAESIFSKGEMGEIEHKIIEKEKIDKRDFIIPEIPFISSNGSRRPIFSKIKNLELCLEKDNQNKEKKILNIKFDLNKGSYATSFLREIMKAKTIKDY